MAELLVLNIDRPADPDPDRDRLLYKKGDVVDVFEDGGQGTGSGMGAPNFVTIVVEGADAESQRFYRDTWDSVAVFTQIGYNVLLDEARVSVGFETPGASNQFVATRAIVEPPMNFWGALFANEQVNDIRFDLSVNSAYQSHGYWRWRDPEEPESPPLPIKITEKTYDPDTRVHTAEIDRTGSDWDWGDITRRAQQRKGVVSDINGDIGTLTVNGDDVAAAMEEDVYLYLLTVNVVRRYYVDPAGVRLISTLPRGRITLTPEQIALQVLDKAER